MSFARWVEAIRENASSILSDEVIVRLKSADFARVAGAWPAVIVGEGALTDDSTRQD
jgi:hypothetical protein